MRAWCEKSRVPDVCEDDHVVAGAEVPEAVRLPQPELQIDEPRRFHRYPLQTPPVWRAAARPPSPVFLFQRLLPLVRSKQGPQVHRVEIGTRVLVRLLDYLPVVISERYFEISPEPAAVLA